MKKITFPFDKFKVPLEKLKAPLAKFKLKFSLEKLERLTGKLSGEKCSIGVDIGTAAIKVIKLKFPKDGVTLADFYIASLTLDPAQVIKKIIDPKDAPGVHVSVSGPGTMIRYVQFPRMNKEELQQALKFEAQKHIPFSINEINLDSYILKDDLPDNKMLILLAAVKKDFMGQRLKQLEEAGLKVNIIDIDSVALVNAFNYAYGKDDAIKGKAIALLNIGASVTNLNIQENGIPYLSRDIHIGGNNVTQKLVDSLGLDLKAAEELKCNPDKNKSANIAASIESVLSHLASEIRVSFDYYESQTASSVSKIFLSGGGSLLVGLREMLGSLLGIEVEHWDPLKKIHIASSVDRDKIKLVSTQLTVAVGLALRQ